MLDFLVTLHVIICIFLVLVIILQRFGSDSITNIGSGGFNNISKSASKSSQVNSFLTKTTIFFAVAFMLNAVFLANLTVKQKKNEEVSTSISAQ